VVNFPIGKMSTNQTIRTADDLGAAIRAARKARGLRLEDVALAAGVGLRFLSELERGKASVRLEETLRVIGALGVQLRFEDPDARG
jgi:HTH-type transcriptional regulator / antitoxin HipB